MGTYNTGVMELIYESDDELRLLKVMYPNDDAAQDLPCPPPPDGKSGT